MNLLQLAQRVKRESGRSGTGPAAVASAVGDDLRIIDWCADAWRDLQNMRRNWRWMRSTTVGDILVETLDYTATSLGATDWGYWRAENDEYRPTAFDAAYPSNEWNLTYLEYDEFRRKFMVGTHAPAVPGYWSVAPTGNLLIGPEASQQYRVRADYFVTPTELEEDADEPTMPSRFHMLLVWRALLQVAGFDAAPELYTRASDNESALFNSLMLDQGEPITINARSLGQSAAVASGNWFR